MAEEQEPTGPSLEPPSLFGRKKKKLVAPKLPPPPAPPDDTPTTILDDVPAAPAASSDPFGSSVAQEANQFGSLDAPAPAATPAPRAPKPPREGPLVPGRVAAAITGTLVGAVIVGLTSASFTLCEKVQGTNSCGGPGFFLLVAILVVAVVLGSLLLRLLQVGEPGSTSFLAVGLTSVIALLFLVDELFEWWMLIVIPLVSAATYLLSHWVTATFVDPEPQVGLAADPEAVDHDVR